MLTKFKLMFVTCSLVLGGVAGVAAAKGGPDRQVLKQKFDADGNGTLDATERANLKQARTAMRAQQRQAKLARFDLDRDGVLDPAEKDAMRDAHAAARFSKLDANGDGLITLAEFKAAKHGMAGKRGGKHGKRGGKHGKRGGKGAAQP